ncbi:hypothetical protein WJX81_006324 [Elliptochloris bilobata]|uniref:BZIP domain-containing protein n=1 Tax=Elliptochloris bilobata TaxID=381761 RepID=A0AAW1RLM7_9CHLO
MQHSIRTGDGGAVRSTPLCVRNLNLGEAYRLLSQERAAQKPPGEEAAGSPRSGMASPSGPLGAPHSSVSDDGRGCDDESADPTFAPVPRKASLSSGDSESAPGAEHCLSGSSFSEAAHMGARAPAMKRKVGRPIADHRHPDTPSLTPQERRRIKRRIANRESARRVRARRQGTLKEMLHRIGELESHNSELLRHTVECEGHCHQLREQAMQFDARWRAMSAENERTEREAGGLRLHLRGWMGQEPQPAPAAHAQPAAAHAPGVQAQPPSSLLGLSPAPSGSMGQVMGCGRTVLAAGRMNTAEMLDALLPSADSLTLPSLEAFANHLLRVRKGLLATEAATLGAPFGTPGKAMQV